MRIEKAKDQRHIPIRKLVRKLTGVTTRRERRRGDVITDEGINDSTSAGVDQDLRQAKRPNRLLVVLGSLQLGLEGSAKKSLEMCESRFEAHCLWQNGSRLAVRLRKGW